MNINEPRFQPGDDVLVVNGQYKGRYGTVRDYEPTFEVYFVTLPELSPLDVFGCTEIELDFLPDSEEDVELEFDDIDEEDEEDLIPVAEFGMSAEQYGANLEYMLHRVLEGVPSTGPAQAFFGFQEWEGMDPKDIYAQILGKIEDGMRLFVQLHILTARVGYALENMEGFESD